jgi:hypothetical protein
MTAPPLEATIQARRVLLVSAAIAIFVALSHVAVLKLPFYWDELGQFVPASLDLFHDGSWIPHSTIANVHPPGVMAYLAAVWSIAGYSIAATRLAMLALAALGAVLTLRLAIRMGLQWNAAILAAGFLATCPLFFAQSMMAELDMPAMFFLVLALGLFLEDRIPVAVSGGAGVFLCFFVAGGKAARSAVVSAASCASDYLAHRSPSRNRQLVRQRRVHSIQPMVSAASGTTDTGAPAAVVLLVRRDRALDRRHCFSDRMARDHDIPHARMADRG